MNVRLFGALALGLATAAFTGCSSEPPETPAAKEDLHDEARGVLSRMEEHDGGLRSFIQSSAGYVIFPSVGKGGLIVGGAYGKGEVYREGGEGRFIGYAELQQATVGAQIGGQTYAELIVFESNDALNRFTSGNFEFSANASAVALKAGAAAAAKYEHGVAVFTMPKGGAMLEASIGGQKFNFQPVSETGGPPSHNR